MAPGILYVTMQPQLSLPTAQFNDWYNNEHGPTRLRLPQFFTNGFRYMATDVGGPGRGKPEWMAIYDMKDTGDVNDEAYTKMRTPAVKSQREVDTMKQIAVDRRIFDLKGEWKAETFKSLEDVSNERVGNVIVAVSLTLKPGKDKEQELDLWYKREHVDMLSKVPGWLRSRRFETSKFDDREEKEYLALHEYAPDNGLGGEEFKAATSTPWNNEIMSNVVAEKRRRVYGLYYTFGPAPRDLSSLSGKDSILFTSPDGQTRTYPAHAPGTNGTGVIESYITTGDGAKLQYRLEGSPDPNAPLILLCNSILVNRGIWDGFIKAFWNSPQNKKYRILRYNSRGRSSDCGSQSVDLDLLSSDIVTFLDALRVRKAAALIGVSLGGATVLNTALKFPERVASFVACDTNAMAPETNKNAWGERIAMAEKEGAQSEGNAIVGDDLADATVSRWFANHQSAEFSQVKKMVHDNSLVGFKKSVQALYAYDLRELIKTGQPKGGFVAGGEDGVLPKTMKDMADSYPGAALHILDDAGHLPMVEKPDDFSKVVTAFLAD